MFVTGNSEELQLWTVFHDQYVQSSMSVDSTKHFPGKPDSRYCGTTDMSCVRETTKSIKTSNFNACLCYPSCSSIKYDVQMNTFNDGTYSVATMFKENYFTPFLRRRVYVLEDVLSSIGGFTGLILGASVMTLIEIIYFAVIPSYKPKPNSEQQKPEKKILETFGELSSIHGINHALSKNRSSCDKLRLG
jgi:hypothetical protein